MMSISLKVRHTERLDISGSASNGALEIRPVANTFIPFKYNLEQPRWQSNDTPDPDPVSSKCALVTVFRDFPLRDGGSAGGGLIIANELILITIATSIFTAIIHLLHSVWICLALLLIIR